MDAARKPKFLRDAPQPKKSRGNPAAQDRHRRRVPNGKWTDEKIPDEEQSSVHESTGATSDILQDLLAYNRQSTPILANCQDTAISNAKNGHLFRKIKALDCISNLVSSSSSHERRKKGVETRRQGDSVVKKSSRPHKAKKSSRGEKTINFDDEIWPTCPKLFNSEELLAKNGEADLPNDELLGDFIVHTLPPTDLVLFRSSITSAERCDESCWNEKIPEPTREAGCGNDVPAASETILNRDRSRAKPVSAKTANRSYDPGKRDAMGQKTVHEIRMPLDYVSPLGLPPEMKLQPVLRRLLDSKSKEELVVASDGSVAPRPEIQVVESIPAPWSHAQRSLQRSRSQKPKRSATRMKSSFGAELVSGGRIQDERVGSAQAESKGSCRFDSLDQTPESLVCDEEMITKTRKMNRDKMQRPGVWKSAGHNRSSPNISPNHKKHGAARRKGPRNERSPREGKTYRRSRPAAACFTSDPRRLSNSFGLQLHRSLAKMNMKAKEYQSDSMFLRRSRTQIRTGGSGARAMKVGFKSTKANELPSPCGEALRDSSGLGSLENGEREEFPSIAIADALKELLDLEKEHSTMGRASTTVARCSIVANSVESKIIDDLGIHEERAEQTRAAPCERASEGSTVRLESYEGTAEVFSESVDCERQESCGPEERHDSSLDCSTTDLLASLSHTWKEAVAEESSLPLTSHFGCIVDLSSEDSIGRSTTTGLSKASLASTPNPDRTRKMTTERKPVNESSTMSSASQTASNESSSQSGCQARRLASTSEQFHPYGSSSTGHKTPERKCLERRVKSLHLLKKILSDQGMDARLLVRAERKLKQKRSIGRIGSLHTSKHSRVVIDKGTSPQLFCNIDASSNTKSDNAPTHTASSISRLQLSEENSEAKSTERNKSASSMPSLEDASRVPKKCTRSSDPPCSRTPPQLGLPADILEAFRIATIRAANLYEAVQILNDHRCKDASVIDSSSNTFQSGANKVDAKADPDPSVGFEVDKTAANRLGTPGICDEWLESHRVLVTSPGESSGTVPSEAGISKEKTVLKTSELGSGSRCRQTSQSVQIAHSSDLAESISSVENVDETAGESKKVSVLGDGIETLHFAGRERMENDTDDGARVDEAPKQILQPQSVSRIKQLLTKNLEHFKSDLHRACSLGQCSDESCSSGDEASLSCGQAGSLRSEWCEETDGCCSAHHAEATSIQNYFPEGTETTNQTDEVNQQCGLCKPRPQCCRSDKGLQTLRGARKAGYCTAPRVVSALDRDDANVTKKLMFFREHLLSIIYGTICLAVFWCLRFSLHCEV